MMFIPLSNKDQLINGKVKSHHFYDLYSPKNSFFMNNKIENW